MHIQLLPGLLLGDLLRSLAIFTGGLLVVWFVYLVGRSLVKRVTAKTKTTLDDAIIRALERPAFLAIVLASAYLTLAVLPFVDRYELIFRRAVGALAVVLGTYTGGRLVNILITWYGQEVASRTSTRIDENILPILRRIVMAGVYGLGAIFLLNQLGVNIAPLLAGLGIGGLAIALAFQSTLGNFFAGTNIATDGAIKVGDFIEVGDGLQGTVREIGWRSTRLTSRTANLIIIPNSRLAESIVTNYSQPAPDTGVFIKGGVAYGSDLDKVERVTLEVARRLQSEHPAAVPGFQPAFVFREFGDSNISFVVALGARGFAEQFALTHDFIKALTARYQQESIEISWPVRKVHLYAHPVGAAAPADDAAAPRSDSGPAPR
ncbi:MAG: mechanosensitive ion channel family protein [Dehalococcoidia bacterium]|nr:mechanosensitive ion channel family protein [Dehalococcoidia bacterium]